jgi:hypothetical protein
LLPFVLDVMRRRVIERAERYLERIFDEEYLRYKARIRGWVYIKGHFRNRSARCG